MIHRYRFSLLWLRYADPVGPTTYRGHAMPLYASQRQRRPRRLGSRVVKVMFPLAHLGIGSSLARPFASKLQFRWILLGTLLPDLIDKPFYFALGLLEHYQTGGWVPGKRGVAHT